MTDGAKLMVEVRGVTRVFREGSVEIRALDNIDFSVETGDFVSLAGPSGSGKSTLLNMIGALDTPTTGTVTVAGQRINELSTMQLADLRLHHIGFVFQAYNLVPVLSAVENVEFIMQLQGVGHGERRQRSLAILEELGVLELANRRPADMSGGQQQRVAVARAIVSEPQLLLADEPSANLDSHTTEELLECFERINRERRMTIVTATHDPAVMRHARRRVGLRDGRVDSDIRADAG